MLHLGPDTGLSSLQKTIEVNEITRKEPNEHQRAWVNGALGISDI
jgi:hypothetical protein